MTGNDRQPRRRQDLPLMVPLADLRRAKGYTTATLLEALKSGEDALESLSLAQLGHIERGVRGTTPAVLAKLAKVLASDDIYGKPVEPTFYTEADIRERLGATA